MKKILKSGVLFVALLLLSPSALAGSGYPPGVSTYGAITTGHCASFYNSTTVQDSGGTCGGTGSPGGTSGQIEYNNSGAFGGFTMSQDCTIVASTGIITCLKTNNVAFTSAATTAIGTSGAVLGLLNSNLTFGGSDTFSVAPTITPFSTSGLVLNSAAGLLSTAATLPAAEAPALSGDVTSTAGSLSTTVAKVGGTTVSGSTGSGSIVFATSPTLTTAALGSSTATTQALGDNSTKVATTAYVDQYDRVFQRVSTLYNAYASGTGTFSLTDTIPTNSGGNLFMSQAITPKSASSTLVIEAQALLGSSVGTNMICALFQDSTTNALSAVSQQSGAGANEPVTVPLRYVMTSGTTSSTTFKIYCGNYTAGTTYFNGNSGSRIFGGVAGSSIIITEYAN